jgi:2-phosphosulfolactate phosphatase
MPALWHIIEGEAGCAFARENHGVAVVVDALRASATAAMLLDAGAEDLLVVGTVEDAFQARGGWPDALLFGERGGLPPEGFDYGNSPRDAGKAKGRRIIFTTTTGAQRCIAAWGSEAVYMGGTVNATAIVNAVQEYAADVVLIPAGLYGDPTFDAQEDWVAAVAIAMVSGGSVGEGWDRYDYWRTRTEREGLPALFSSAPHAEKLRRVGLEIDIAYCAQRDLTPSAPRAVERTSLGLRMADGRQPKP